MHRMRNRFGSRFGFTQCNSKVTWVKWKLILLRLEIVLILVQDRCTVSLNVPWAWKSYWPYPMALLGTLVKGRLVSVRLEIVLVSTQDRCTV